MTALGTPSGESFRLFESLTGSFLETLPSSSGGLQSQAEEWDHLGVCARKKKICQGEPIGIFLKKSIWGGKAFHTTDVY